jgi:ribosomal subunit interface protein
MWMNIELTSGKDIVVPEVLRERLEQKLSKVESRLGQKVFFRVRLSKESVDSFSCQIHFNGARTEFNASAQEDDLIKSSDQAVSKIERQLKKYLTKNAPRGGESIRDTVDLEPIGETDL